MTDTIATQRWLGLKPFVLVELTGADVDDNGEVTGLKTEVQFGGGIVERADTDEELDYAEVLAMLLQGMGWQLTTPEGEVLA